MTGRFGRIAQGLFALTTCACGDPLVSGDRLEEPAFSFTGIVTPAPDAAALRFGLLWIDPAQQGSGNDTSGSDLVREHVTADGRFTIDLLGPPPANTIRRMSTNADGGPEFAFAWAEIVIYEDRDGDGNFRVGDLADGSPILPPDVYRGASEAHVLLYVEQPLERSEVLAWEFRELIVRKGYLLGNVLCQSRLSVRVVDAPRDVAVHWLEPSSTFPELRTCLRSQPHVP